MQSILDTLNEKSIVFDGAMGTMLFSKGVFLNQCFDELNVSSPEIVTQVHEEYIRAGADVLTTNTFGANRIKLESFGMADRVGEINKAGRGILEQTAADVTVPLLERLIDKLDGERNKGKLTQVLEDITGIDEAGPSETARQ